MITDNPTLCSFVNAVSIETSRGSTFPDAKSARAGPGSSRFGFSSSAASSAEGVTAGPAAASSPPPP
jgi:hypothetical protein